MSSDECGLNILSERIREVEIGLGTLKSEIAQQKNETARVKSAMEAMESALRTMNDEVSRVRVDVQMVERRMDPDPRRRISVTG
jgi:archaellum component FlaC